MEVTQGHFGMLMFVVYSRADKYFVMHYAFVILVLRRLKNDNAMYYPCSWSGVEGPRR